MTYIMFNQRKANALSRIFLVTTLVVAFSALVLYVYFAEVSINIRLFRCAIALALFIAGILGGAFILVPQLHLASCSESFLRQLCISFEILPIFVVLISVVGMFGDPSRLFLPLYPSAGMVLVASIVLGKVEQYKPDVITKSC